jgi:site-specific recombinase XerD
MNDQCSLGPVLLDELPVGPLTPYLNGFLEALLERGYTQSTATDKIRIVCRLNQWLEEHQLTVDVLTETTIEDFISYRKAKNRLDDVGPPTFRQLLSFLRREGVSPVPASAVDDSLLSRIESSFARHLIEERGLNQNSLQNYLPTVRRFLVERFSDGKVMLKSLCPKDISAFLIRCAHTVSPGRAQTMVVVLRSFFRFLYKRGDISTDLAGSVPTVAGSRFYWKGATVAVR